MPKPQSDPKLRVPCQKSSRPQQPCTRRCSLSLPQRTWAKNPERHRIILHAAPAGWPTWRWDMHALEQRYRVGDAFCSCVACEPGAPAPPSPRIFCDQILGIGPERHPRASIEAWQSPSSAVRLISAASRAGGTHRRRHRIRRRTSNCRAGSCHQKQRAFALHRCRLPVFYAHRRNTHGSKPIVARYPANQISPSRSPARCRVETSSSPG